MAFGTSTGMANYSTNQSPQYQPQITSNQNPLGFVDVNGMDGINRYPVGPGASVNLRDVNTDLVFVKARDISGQNIPMRVFQIKEVTDEYFQNEEPVTRKEFKQLLETINKLQDTLEFLTSPTVKENNNA